MQPMAPSPQRSTPTAKKAAAPFRPTARVKTEEGDETAEVTLASPLPKALQSPPKQLGLGQLLRTKKEVPSAIRAQLVPPTWGKIAAGDGPAGFDDL